MIWWFLQKNTHQARLLCVLKRVKCKIELSIELLIKTRVRFGVHLSFNQFNWIENVSLFASIFLLKCLFVYLQRWRCKACNICRWVSMEYFYRNMYNPHLKALIRFGYLLVVITMKALIPISYDGKKLIRLDASKKRIKGAVAQTSIVIRSNNCIRIFFVPIFPLSLSLQRFPFSLVVVYFLLFAVLKRGINYPESLTRLMVPLSVWALYGDISES